MPEEVSERNFCDTNICTIKHQMFQMPRDEQSGHERGDIEKRRNAKIDLTLRSDAKKELTLGKNVKRADTEDRCQGRVAAEQLKWRAGCMLLAHCTSSG